MSDKTLCDKHHFEVPLNNQCSKDFFLFFGTCPVGFKRSAFVSSLAEWLINQYNSWQGLLATTHTQKIFRHFSSCVKLPRNDDRSKNGQILFGMNKSLVGV